MINLNELKAQYLEYLEIERGASKKTLENYHRYLLRFLLWAKIKDPKDLNQELVRKYRLYLNRLTDSKQKPLKSVTQNYHLIALRGFLRYLVKRDIKSLSPEKIELAKNEERQINLLTIEELGRLLDAPAKEKPSLKNLRDHAILQMLFSTGLRVSELCNLNREKIDFQKGELSIRGKGGKIRIVFISEKAKETLKAYLDKRKDPDPALFARTRQGTASNDLRLTPRSIQRIVQKWAGTAGIIKEVHPHTLRHLFATDLLSAGADVRAVQELLGHSNISTTQIYTHITNPQLKNIHQKFHGKSMTKRTNDKK